ncbi:MAG: tyrosine--tRNA ligase [Peptostreptococcaceae bacterium]|nr:tyrosine--tRNA ligase [Peptostreptococcaceae bacterium]
MLRAEEQIKIILKGVDSFVNEEELLAKLKRSVVEKRPLVIKLGLDPSAPDIHLGHAVVLRKIKQMQDLGHRVVIIIGDFTGKIGDPTGKSKGRVALTEEQVNRNAQTYCDQIFKVLDKGRTEVRKNSEWLSKLHFEDVIRLASTMTIARMLERDDFSKRYLNQIPIGLHEFFYPLMQAYDSIAIDADIELGGTDQTFNILMGRNLQKAMNKEQQIALFMPILEGLDGVEKMSKSLGNYIGVSESAEVMFKKVMEIPDDLIIKYYELTTDEHPDKITEIRRDLQNGKNPRDVKLELARIITALYHSPDEVEKAIQYYDQAFGKKGIPEDIPELKISAKGIPLTQVLGELVERDFVSSKSEFHRLVSQGGVQKNGEKISSMDEPISSGDVLRIGKKKFVRFV